MTDAKIARLQKTVIELAGYQGIDIIELIEDGFIDAGDLDD